MQRAMERKSNPQPSMRDVLVRKLQACGIMPTRQRVEIAQVLFARCVHLSADQLLAAVNADAARVF